VKKNSISEHRGNTMVYTYESAKIMAEGSVRELISDYIKRANKGNYDFLMGGKCPHCRKHQSWEKKEFSWLRMLNEALFWFVLCVVFGAICGGVIFFLGALLGGNEFANEYLATPIYWLIVLFIY